MLVDGAAGAVTVSSTEIWDGGEMRGITPAGSGTAGDPYVYAIPDGMTFTSGGVIKMNDKYVTFNFSSSSGGLNMAVGSYFDLTGSTRRSDPGECTIILGGNDLTGDGDFKTVDSSKDSMDVNISGSGDVTVSLFDLHVSDAFVGALSVDVGGSVNIGSVDTKDDASGGNNGGDVTIRGSDIAIGDIDTRALRTASSVERSGNVVLEARDYWGDNTLDNMISLYGVIDTDSAIGTDSDIAISGVVVTLESGFGAVTGDGSVQISAGMVQYGKTAGELFIDNSGGGYSAVHSVFWTGSGGEYYASYPRPLYGAKSVDPNVVLNWTPGVSATGHDVYLGADFDEVNGAGDPNTLPGRGRQDSNSYAPAGLLEFGVTYYWRIDEVNDADTNSPWRGTVWMFTVDDGKAGDPSPAHGASSVPVDVNLSWTAGVLAVSHDVYLGTDLDDVNDAATDSSEFMGNRETDGYDPCGLELNTIYYWRIDEVGDSTRVKGQVWNFRTAVVRILGHSIVYGEPDKFCGWPANNGVWIWGNEILVGFVYGPYVEIPGHNLGSPSYTGLGRSLDGGRTWTMEDPNNFVGDGGTPVPSPANINFAYPDFAWRTVSYTSNGQFFFSYDRGHTWQGPYTCGDLMSHPELSGLENSSRTDYVVNGPDDCLIGMSARVYGSGLADRAFMARTTDGGATFSFVSWVNPEPVSTTRGVMPSTVRLSETKLVTALRRKNPGDWIDVFVSYDNGGSWLFLSKVTDTYCCNGNPPALVRLSDGRLCCAYGNRADWTIEARFSEDEGATWSEEIVLRDDYQTDAYGDADLGYCRMVQRPDGRLVTMYYWATPEHPTHHIAATIWDSGLTIDPGFASYPRPGSGAEDVPRDVVLRWMPGLYAASHDVYFGGDFYDVDDADTSSAEYRGSQNLEADTYDPCGLLELGTTYYWRIDEVNDAYTWKGDVWRFATIDYIVLDDMEPYGLGENPIYDTWRDGFKNWTGSLIDLGITGDPVHGGEQSMEFAYDNDDEFGSEKYSEIDRSFADPCDWAGPGVRVLALWFYGDPENDAGDTEQMYVGLDDSRGVGSYAEVKYGDMNDIREAEWHEWNMDMEDFNDAGVILTDVNRVYIGFGDRGNPQPGGSGVVYYDDIRLYVPRCIPEFGPLADLSGDCVVDHKDLKVLVDEWLVSGEVIADLYGDNVVDFKDYAVLAGSWLDSGLWP